MINPATENVLLARHLVKAGVRLVTISYDQWDRHWQGIHFNLKRIEIR